MTTSKLIVFSVSLVHAALLIAWGSAWGAGGPMLWALSFLTSASVYAEAALQRVDDAPGEASLELVTGIALLVMVLATATRVHGVSQATGLGAVGVGIGLRAVAVRTLGVSFTTHPQGDVRWVTHGIYRYLRHPSEWGLAIYGAGLAWMARHPVVTVAWIVSLGVALLRIRREEAALQNRRETISCRS